MMSNPIKTVDHSLEYIAELQRLRRGLPETTDGKTVVLGMLLFYQSGKELGSFEVTGIDKSGEGHFDIKGIPLSKARNTLYTRYDKFWYNLEVAKKAMKEITDA